jgi:hypothetical protein
MPEQKIDTRDRWILNDNSFISLGYHSGVKVYPNDKFRFEFVLPASPSVLLIVSSAGGGSCRNTYRAHGMSAGEAYNARQYTWGPVDHNLGIGGAHTCFVYDIGAVLLANGFAEGNYVGLEIEATTITGVDYYHLYGVRVNDILCTP